MGPNGLVRSTLVLGTMPTFSLINAKNTNDATQKSKTDAMKTDQKELAQIRAEQRI